MAREAAQSGTLKRDSLRCHAFAKNAHFVPLRAAELYEVFEKRKMRPVLMNRAHDFDSILIQSAAFRLRLPEVVSTEISALSRRSAPERSLLTLPLTVLK